MLYWVSKEIHEMSLLVPHNTRRLNTYKWKSGKPTIVALCTSINQTLYVYNRLFLTILHCQYRLNKHVGNIKYFFFFSLHTNTQYPFTLTKSKANRKKREKKRIIFLFFHYSLFDIIGYDIFALFFSSIKIYHLIRKEFNWTSCKIFVYNKIRISKIYFILWLNFWK